VRRSAEIGSDHYLVKMNLKIECDIQQESKRKITKEKIRCHRLKEEKVKEKYRENLERYVRTRTTYQNIEERWEEYKQSLITAAKESCGITRISNDSKKRTAWWTGEIEKTVKEKKQVWKRYLADRSQENYDRYKQKRTEVKKMIKDSKDKTWIEFGNKLTETFGENQKLFYSALKQMRKPKTNMLKNVKDKNGNTLTNEEDIIDRWREYFKELLEEDENEILNNEQNNEQHMPQEDYGHTEGITETELIKAIQKMKIGKAPGHDEVTTEMIKYMSDERNQELLGIMNQAKSEKKVPLDWQIGIITPIYKKGDSMSCSNFRGITLGSTVGKIYARILEHRLRDRLDNTLEESQSGFRKERGTNDQIFILRQLSEKAIRTGKQIHACFIDMEKAFDRVKREDIWKILENRGIEKDLIQNIQSLYEKTESYIRLRNEKSKPFANKIGLRQGCILSPLLFNLMLDEAIKQNKDKLKPYNVGYWKLRCIRLTELCYADDLIILGETEKQLQENINNLNEGLKTLNMKINKQKTKTMIIGQQSKKHNIQIDDEALEQVDKFTYLGVIINKEGTLEDEINGRIAKTGRLYNSIKSNFLGKKEIPKQIKTEIVKKIVKPTLTYACESWTLTQKQKSRITSTEMRFLRRIEGKTRKDKIRNQIFRENLNIVPVETTIEQGQLRWLGHVIRRDENRLIKQIFEAKEMGKKKRGRPRRTWKEEVRTAAEKRGVGWEDIKVLASDRTKWKEIWKKVEISTTT
jgi:uncharacterized protein YukE